MKLYFMTIENFFYKRIAEKSIILQVLVPSHCTCSCSFVTEQKKYMIRTINVLLSTCSATKIHIKLTKWFIVHLTNIHEYMRHKAMATAAVFVQCYAFLSG